MALEGRGMAVIEMAAKGIGVKLIDELLAGLDLAGTGAGDAVVRLDGLHVAQEGVFIQRRQPVVGRDIGD